MSRIRSTDTAPERVVRARLSRTGIRYRMNVRDLPGKLDFANKRRKFAIFVHGCFWHSHQDRRLASNPKSNRVTGIRSLREQRLEISRTQRC